ncbi:ACT domain-containing protein [Methanosarcina sp. DH2]|uniref:ACT domain-containing protein n=1 Tax=Methanosarcina sp. DH2 TaxID=2605639 RepID=UPI0031F6C453
MFRFEKESEVPAWVYGGNFFSIKSTSKKLSVACQESSIPADIPAGTRAEKGWSCLKVEGPLDFGLTGILAGISRTLAENGVSLFAISTYDTDYILVRETDLEHAAGTLKKEYGIQKP